MGHESGAKQEQAARGLCEASPLRGLTAGRVIPLANRANVGEDARMMKRLLLALLCSIAFQASAQTGCTTLPDGGVVCLPPRDVECQGPLTRRVCSPVLGGQFCRCEAVKIVPICTVEIVFVGDSPSEPILKADSFCARGDIEAAVGVALSRLLLGMEPTPR